MRKRVGQRVLTGDKPAGRGGPGVALLLVDVINDMDFDGAESLVRHALPMAKRLARLKQRATRAGIPSIYVNDNTARENSSALEQMQSVMKATITESSRLQFSRLALRAR